MGGSMNSQNIPQRRAYDGFFDIMNRSNSSSQYLIMILGDMLYNRYNIAVVLRGPSSLLELTDQQALRVLELLPELDDGYDLSSEIQKAVGL